MAGGGVFAKMSKKTGIALANYLNEKIKFEYKDGKVILTPLEYRYDIDTKTHIYSI